MLNENIRTIRKSRGLSQEELAVRLDVVRQTVSKWENGISVPDSEMLISLSEVLETPVSVLLGENVSETKKDDLKIISEKLEAINLQMARKNEKRKKLIQWILILICAVTVILFIAFFNYGSSYLDWNYDDPETAVTGVGIHAVEWIFVRVAPFILIGAVIGIIIIRKKSR